MEGHNDNRGPSSVCLVNLFSFLFLISFISLHDIRSRGRAPDHPLNKGGGSAMP